MFRLLLLCFVSAAWVSAQEPLYTVKVDVPFVSVDVTVTDPSGHSINDLTPDAFQILEDGIPHQIRSFSPVSAPYHIFLLFDRSGSTQHKWPLMQRAVAGFISNLRPQDRVSIAAFDFELEVVARWTDSRTDALNALSEVTRPKAVGGTEFYRSLERVLRQEFRNVSGRRTVVVLSDGRDTGLYRRLVQTNKLPEPAEEREFQRTFKTAHEKRIPTYFIAVNTDRNFEPNTQGGDEYRNLQMIFPDSDVAKQYLLQVRLRMEQISEVSGGRILYPKSIEDIVPLYAQIGRELGTAYSLGYVPSGSASASAYRRIEVKVKDPRLRLTQTRSGYYVR